jgi:heptosyltransferase-2/heptosyltransferase-3
LTSGNWSGPLLRGQPGVGEVFVIRSRKTPYWLAPDQRRIVHALKQRGVGPTWLCDADAAAARLLRRAGFTDADLVDVRAHALRSGEHATEQWRRMAAVLPGAWTRYPRPGAATGEQGCSLSVSCEQRAELELWLRGRGLEAAPLICVQIGNKRTMRRGTRRLAANFKYWPQERWALVLRHIRARCPRHRIVLLGTGPEFAMNQALARAAGVEGIENVADDLPVTRLVALLARAAALLTVDSGPAHVAAAVACPQVVLFGKASPSLYRPWGSANPQTLLISGQLGAEPSMLGIAAETVIRSWDQLECRGS